MPRIRPAQKPPVPPVGLTKGVYLTDISEDPKGRGLFRVLDVVELQVEIENCMLPKGMPQWVPVAEVLKKMRVIRRG